MSDPAGSANSRSELREREPLRGPPLPRWWLTVKEALVILPMLGLVGTLYGVWSGWIRSGAAEQVDSRYAAKHQEAFEADTIKKFAEQAAGADRRFMEQSAAMERGLKEVAAQIAAINLDRDTRTLTINSRVDTMQGAVISRIEDLQRQIATRTEQRVAQVNDLNQQVSDLRLRVCVLGGLRVSQCK